MTEIGLAVPAFGTRVHPRRGAGVAEQVGYPLIVRPSFILGGGGTGIAANTEEMRKVAEHGLAASPVVGDPHRAVASRAGRSTSSR